MTRKRLLVTGGSGFIGRHLLARLSNEGHHVTALVRSRQSAERLASFSIDTVVVDTSSDHELASCFDQQDAAINLVGILHETPSNTFEAVFEELPLRLLRHCQTAGGATVHSHERVACERRAWAQSLPVQSGQRGGRRTSAGHGGGSHQFASLHRFWPQ